MGLIGDIGGFFKRGGSAAASALDQLGQFTAKLQDIIDSWDEIKDEWMKLFEPQEVSEAGNWRVIKVNDAQMVLEEIRVGALKDRAIKLYDDIKGIIALALHPVGGSSEADAAIAAGAAAYAGKPGAGAGALKAATFIESILFFEDRVLEIEDKVLEVVQLLDVIGQMRDEIEAGALQQGNSQIPIDGSLRRRVGKLLHGKTRS